MAMKTTFFNKIYFAIIFYCTLINPIVGFSQWTAIDTVNEKYNCIYFKNNNEGYLGGKGYYKKTSDAGSSWVRTTVGGENDFVQKIYFIDSLRGFLGGYWSWAKATNDGGDTWDTITNFTYPFCFTENNRYAFSSVYIPFANPYPTFSSNNYGATWHMRSWVQPEQGAFVSGIKSIHFADSLHGMISSGSSQLFLTKDGGDTWELNKPFSTDHDLNSIYMLNKSIAYMIAIDDHPFSRSSTKILRTDDGGESWNIISTIEDNVMTKIQFIDEQRGFACSDRWYPHYFFTTTDGGYTWQQDSTVQYVVDFSISEDGNLYLLTWDSLLAQNGSVMKRDLLGSINNKLNNVDADKVLLYPNPANDFFKLRITDNPFTVKSISIQDISGKEKANIVPDTFLNDEYRINIEQLPKGVYVVILQNEQHQVLHKKLMVY